MGYCPCRHPTGERKGCDRSQVVFRLRGTERGSLELSKPVPSSSLSVLPGRRYSQRPGLRTECPRPHSRLCRVSSTSAGATPDLALPGFEPEFLVLNWVRTWRWSVCREADSQRKAKARQRTGPVT